MEGFDILKDLILIEIYQSTTQNNHEIIIKKSKVKKPLTLKDLKGLGKEIWKDVDVEDYIKKQRESW